MYFYWKRASDLTFFSISAFKGNFLWKDHLRRSQRIILKAKTRTQIQYIYNFQVWPLQVKQSMVDFTGAGEWWLTIILLGWHTPMKMHQWCPEYHALRHFLTWYCDRYYILWYCDKYHILWHCDNVTYGQLETNHKSGGRAKPQQQLDDGFLLDYWGIRGLIPTTLPCSISDIYVDATIKLLWWFLWGWKKSVHFVVITNTVLTKLPYFVI